ncbi:MAG: hypothetical protein V9F04_05400 [Dermatophilaceae bacterium]
MNSVKVLKICTQVNEELTQRQKFVVLVHLLEFIHAGGEVGEQELEFVSTVAETFNISARRSSQRCQDVRRQPDHGCGEDAAHLLYIDAAARPRHGATREHLHAHGLEGEMRVLHVPSVSLYVMRYTGQDRGAAERAADHQT